MTDTADLPIQHTEHHYVSRVGWLRAAVLGANDGIVSTASLIAGVASAGMGTGEVLLAGTAGLVAGAMSMAAGEYVSVSSQADTERADLAREAHELEVHFELELEELAEVYVERGLSAELAHQVAGQLMEKDALEAHARDELGISSIVVARPLQAAVSSAISFSVGAALPLASVLLAKEGQITMTTTVASVISLGLLGVVSARAGGAPVMKAVIRVMFWGAFAMAATAAVGSLFNVPVAQGQAAPARLRGAGSPIPGKPAGAWCPVQAARPAACLPKHATSIALTSVFPFAHMRMKACAWQHQIGSTDMVQTLLTAISDPIRRGALAIVWGGGEHCVCELMARLDVSQSRMSRHMKVLRLAGLVTDRRDAQWVRYRRNPDLAPELAAIVDAVLAAETEHESDVA